MRNIIKSLLCIYSITLLWGCSQEDKLFTLMDESASGINFKNTFFEDGPLNVANYIYFYNGGGVSIGDINNDGLQDVLFTGNMVRNRLFLNKGNFQFEDITKTTGIADQQGWCTGATMEDVNGDGKLDIYICRSADINPDRRKNLLFINEGNLKFTEKADEYGLADNGYSTQASFLDYDKDGDLDCFIINHSVQKYTAGVQDNPELRNESNPDYASKLYRNDKGHYTEVSQSAGIKSNVLSFGLSVAVADFNDDGWPDIAVSNDFNEPDYFFINNKNGTFSEELANAFDNISLYSMGSDAADYNNDGLLDLITLDMMPEDNTAIKMHSGAENFDKFQLLFNKGFYYQYSRNMLQKNNGDGTFSEVGQLAGVSNTDWSWAALFSDFDLDGHKDLFVSNGYVKDYTEMDFLKYSVDRVIKNMAKEEVDGIPEYIRKMPTNQLANYIFKNNGNGTFTKKIAEWGLDKVGVSGGAAYADLDNDGDLDLIVNNANDFASIYRNNAEKKTKNNYLRLHLQGQLTNPRGIGTKIKIYTNGQLYYQEQSPVRGFQSSVDPILNFGLGNNTLIDSVLVIWPNDKYQKLTKIKSNQTLKLNISEATHTFIYQQLPPTLFTQQTIDGVIHQESQSNDFAIQSLLPNFLSRQGPCIEVADVNKDGLQDFFMGGAKGTPSQIYLQNQTGNFVLKNNPDFSKDALCEDASACFFDADSDGDLDLYVASGSYEFPENSASLQDRLYMNDGKGNFTKNTAVLPPLLSSKGVVKAADIDQDGDIDLFVGARVVPGKYPNAPESYLLENNGKGVFTNKTKEICPDIAQVGMVTDALWLDVNNDKFQDLIIVGEFMPIKVFVNTKGKFKDASNDYIKFPNTGWWNTLIARDMDNDGDQDLIIGNNGLNSQFKVTDKEPMTLYAKDFDNSGSVVPVLCYYIEGQSYPMASRDDLASRYHPSRKNLWIINHTPLLPLTIFLMLAN
ncbi:MAG: VCBS repeat-containing protein [Spirosomataceae bacterium]